MSGRRRGVAQLSLPLAGEIDLPPQLPAEKQRELVLALAELLLSVAKEELTPDEPRRKNDFDKADR